MRILTGGITKALSEARMRAVGLAVLPIVASLLAGTEAAQDRDGQWNSCVVDDEHSKLSARPNPDLVIGACSAIIQSSQESTGGLAQVFFNRGVAYGGKREYDRAIQDLDEAIKLDSNYTRALVIRGNVYQNKGEHDRAIRDYDKAIRLEPDNATAFNNRGFAYNAKREYDRAIQDFDQAIEGARRGSPPRSARTPRSSL